MPVDNALYDSLADSWWDEEGVFATLRALNPARFGYMRRVLAESGLDLQGRKTLDVGCGGGILAEEFARLGCDVTGIDPSEPSIEAARDHASREGLAIEYRVGTGEALPFPDGSFEIVYCCDVLEHVADVPRVISEVARVLAPGAVFFYDTINRTLRSRLVMINLLQEWRSTRLLPPDLHDWNHFIKPAELRSLLIAGGLKPRGLTGLRPAVNPLRAIRILRDRARGKLTYFEALQKLEVRESRDTSLSYMGWALKMDAELRQQLRPLDDVH
jgi:2-polyprenyl-6-hydroxyphenyl methylase / 3-demethylubiquinone-9 3-methyltransferase